jgi:hypothetical protein
VTPSPSSPSASEYPELADPAPPSGGDGDSAAGGLPLWVPPLAVGGVLAGAGAALVLRRRLGAGS